MGKSNRIRINRANERMNAPAVKQKKQMPSWVLSVITLVCAIALILGVAAGLMTSKGTFARMRTAAKSEDYRVSGTAMAYFFWNEFDSFVSDNESYMDYYSLTVNKNATRAEQAAALRAQSFGSKLADGSDSMDVVMLGEFSGTWFDYIAKLAKDTVAKTLVYCEEADRRGLSLTKDELDAIDTNIDSLEMIASIYGYTTASYLSASYGTGVNVKDVRKAMQLDALSARCQQVIEDEYKAAISDTEISDRYNGDTKKYDKIDYSYYGFSVKYTDVAKKVLGADHTSTELKADETGEKKVLAEYKKMIAEAKAKAAELAKITDAEQFKNYILDYVADLHFEAVYGDAEFASDDKTVMADAKATVKTEMIRIIKEALKEGKTSITATEYKDGKIYGVTVSEACAKVLQEVEKDVFEDVYADKLAYIRSEIGYVKDDKFSEWAFAGDKAAGAIYTENTGDGAKEEIADTVDPSNLDKSFTAKAYLLVKAPYADGTLTRDVAYMVFGTEDAAKNAVTALKGTQALTYEAFEKIAGDNAADTVRKVENCYKGQMGSTAFDDWFFADTRKVGDYSDAPAKLEDGSFGVFFYMAEGDAQWIVDIRHEIAEERMEEGFTALSATFAVTFNDKTIAKIGK